LTISDPASLTASRSTSARRAGRYSFGTLERCSRPRVDEAKMLVVLGGAQYVGFLKKKAMESREIRHYL
jgi:hypothetical protein